MKQSECASYDGLGLAELVARAVSTTRLAAPRPVLVYRARLFLIRRRIRHGVP